MPKVFPMGRKNWWKSRKSRKKISNNHVSDGKLEARNIWFIWIIYIYVSRDLHVYIVVYIEIQLPTSGYVWGMPHCVFIARNDGFGTGGIDETSPHRPWIIHGYCSALGRYAIPTPQVNYNGFWTSKKLLGFCAVYRSGWWFQFFLMFSPTWGNDPIWLIFFRWVETTNRRCFSFSEIRVFSSSRAVSWLRVVILYPVSLSHRIHVWYTYLHLPTIKINHSSR